MTIALCCPLFNGIEYTQEMVDSIKTKQDLKLFFHDNNSTDQTAYYLDKGLPPFPMVFTRSTANEGVSRGANRVIKAAYNDPTITHIIYCNNDIVFRRETIDALVWAWDNKDDAKIKIISGVEVNAKKIGTKAAWEAVMRVDVTKPIFGFGASHTCYIIDKKTIDECGQYDEEVDYYDDNIYSEEILRKGFLPVCFAPAVFFHYGSVSTKIKSLDEVEAHHKKFNHDREYAFKYFGVNSQDGIRDIAINWGISWKSKIIEINGRLEYKKPTYINYPTKEAME